jgi:DNA-binding XRE family transcriptional regulator
MKAMTRQELADCAGVTTKTLGNYIKRHRDELWALGMRPREILPPSVVAWLVNNYGIDI